MNYFDADSLDEIDKTYQSIADLGVKLKDLREESSRHGQVINYAAIFHSVCRSTQHMTQVSCLSACIKILKVKS